jgi:glycosyltransferase involved in cell wall biosynthesis
MKLWLTLGMISPNLAVAPDKARLSIIFSFYNEELNIPGAISHLSQVLEAEIRAGNLGDFELVFVDDESNDRSQEMLVNAAHANPRIKYIRMARNFGHYVCGLAGLEMCTGDLAVYMDADLQDPPELIPDMLKLWREKNADVVHTVRTSREGESMFKLFVTKIGYAILRKFSRVKLESNCGDFKMISRRALNEVVKFREVNPFMRGIVTFVGFNQEKIYYARKPRVLGVSAYPVLSWRVIAFFLDSALISFSDVPLKLVSLAGFATFTFSILLSGYVLVERYLGNTVPGWSGVMVVVSFMGGIQLFSMGILGLYLNSIFLDVKRRPRYIVESKINL